MNIPNYYYQPQQPVDERIWVNNEQAAEAYLVAPNGFVRLWDANASRFYEKRSDASGRPLPMETYEYTKCIVKTQEDTKIDSINERLDRLEEMIRNATESDGNDSTVQSIQGTI